MIYEDGQLIQSSNSDQDLYNTKFDFETCLRRRGRDIPSVLGLFFVKEFVAVPRSHALSYPSGMLTFRGLPLYEYIYFAGRVRNLKPAD
jgi:hypothetical protein